MQPSGQHSFSETGNTGIRLVLFCTSWSIPCRQQGEILDNLCNHYGNDTEITKIDIDHSPEFADRWTIQAIPTTLLLSGDREIDRFIGLLSVDMLQAILDNHVPPVDKAAGRKRNHRK